MPGSGLLTESSLPCHPPTPPLPLPLSLSFPFPFPLPLAAFPGSAKCSEPRPHPVHTQARGAGERVCHSDVSRSVRRLRRTSPSGKTRSPFWGWEERGGGLSQPSELFLKWRQRSQTPWFPKCANKNTKSPLSHPCTIFFFFFFQRR